MRSESKFGSEMGRGTTTTRHEGERQMTRERRKSEIVKEKLCEKG